MTTIRRLFSNDAHRIAVDRCRMVAFIAGVFLIFHGTIELTFGIRLLDDAWLVSIIITGWLCMAAYIIGFILLKTKQKQTK